MPAFEIDTALFATSPRLTEPNDTSSADGTSAVDIPELKFAAPQPAKARLTTQATHFKRLQTENTRTLSEGSVLDVST